MWLGGGVLVNIVGCGTAEIALEQSVIYLFIKREAIASKYV